jgi:hypothetical protein
MSLKVVWTQISMQLIYGILNIINYYLFQNIKFRCFSELFYKVAYSQSFASFSVGDKIFTILEVGDLVLDLTVTATCGLVNELNSIFVLKASVIFRYFNVKTSLQFCQTIILSRRKQACYSVNTLKLLSELIHKSTNLNNM